MFEDKGWWVSKSIFLNQISRVNHIAAKSFILQMASRLDSLEAALGLLKFHFYY